MDNVKLELSRSHLDNDESCKDVNSETEAACLRDGM